MYFPWNKYKELPTKRINTVQVFITTYCNLSCAGCFAKNIMGDKTHMSIIEYKKILDNAKKKGCERITLIGGEPLLHPEIKKMVSLNNESGIKTTIYTNGYFLNKYKKEDLPNAKIRVSIYCKSGIIKNVNSISKTEIDFDVCFMVSKNTTIEELVESATYLENYRNCKVFFISSLRELDNEKKEFFEDTELTMPVIQYKSLVHNFLKLYNGNMEIHVSKRGVFESTINTNGNKCKFSNCFTNDKIIQCPYDIVNEKFQNDYSFDTRFCQHNNTCLMSKVVFKKI